MQTIMFCHITCPSYLIQHRVMCDYSGYSFCSHSQVIGISLFQYLPSSFFPVVGPYLLHAETPRSVCLPLNENLKKIRACSWRGSGKALDDLNVRGRKHRRGCWVASVGGGTTGSRPASAPSPRPGAGGPGWSASRTLARRPLSAHHDPILRRQSVMRRETVWNVSTMPGIGRKRQRCEARSGWTA